ncbi:MAG: hypothetical protein ABIY70_17480 [Capsulimonas sp.]|uniref:hypothetical protein n=1 Tax=Capsulimonas sp. TaxID=2494211 RepID=UPI003266F31E
MIAFQKDLAIVYPDLEAIPEDKLEDSPWSFSPDRSGGHTFLCIRWSAVDAAVPIIFEIALKHNLVVYDPQDDEVYVSNELFDASPQP